MKVFALHVMNFISDVYIKHQLDHFKYDFAYFFHIVDTRQVSLLILIFNFSHIVIFQPYFVLYHYVSVTIFGDCMCRS